MCLSALAACDQHRDPPSAKSQSAENPIVQETREFESGVRLAAANKRIDELELKVRTLEATPEKLDLDLLTQRVTALEVRASGAPAAVSEIAPVKNAMQASRPPNGRGTVRSETGRASVGTSRLNLPDLEDRPRRAASGEATDR